jgi:four helix bundle protein
MNDDVRLEHETLDVYNVALRAHEAACAALPQRGARIIRDQLERATPSIVLNVAEGAGRRSAPDKRRFYEVARGSATETAALLDVLRTRGLASPEACRSARTLLVRVVQMLSKLVGPPRA